jgi:archaemetzincin
MTTDNSESPLLPLTRGLITVVPFGHIKEDVLKVVADGLQGILRLPVDVGDPLDLPEDTYLAQRDQYNAMGIIKQLETDHSYGSLKVLGITRKDITTPILTYVFGFAYMDGKAAMISTCRLRLAPGGEPVSREHYLDRVVKVAIHEIGHTFNVPHCHRDRCVMRASNSIVELDDKLNYMCSYCELFLSEAVTKALRPRSQESGELP